jgi:hypothetical protein
MAAIVVAIVVVIRIVIDLQGQQAQQLLGHEGFVAFGVISP